MKIITVYGSSKVRPGDNDYEASLLVGRKLAEAGYAVMTGGYYGVMEAISKGAHEAGGHVIGAITDQIGKRYNLKPNPYVKEVINYPKLRDRILHMIEKADGYVAMPGGVGTLHEIAETWELMRVGGAPVRPFVCYGTLWKTVIDALHDSPYLGDGYEGMLSVVQTPEDVIPNLKM